MGASRRAQTSCVDHGGGASSQAEPIRRATARRAAALGPGTAGVAHQHRNRKTIAGTGGQLEVDLDLTFQTFQNTQDRVGGVEPDPMAPLIWAEGTGVREGNGSVAGSKHGPEHHRIGEVGALNFRFLFRADEPVPGIWPQNPSEDRRRIESGEGRPSAGTSTAYEG